MHLFRLSAVLAASGTILGVGCGGGESTPPAPTPTQMAKVSGDSQVATAGATLRPFSVVVKDAGGSPVANATVSWALVAGGGSIASSGVTDASGLSTGTLTLGSNAGTQTTTAAHSGLTGSPITFTSFSQIQGATSIQANGGANQMDTVLATLATPMSVLVRDYKNVPVSGVSVNWSVTSGSVSQATTMTDGSGISSVTRTLGATAGSQGTVATVSGLVGSPVTITATATAGNATQMALNGGDGQTGSINTALAQSHSVIVHDAYGNVKSGVTVTWAVGDGGGSVSSTSPVTGSNGVASVTRTLGPSAGTNTDTAKVSGLSGSPVVFTATATTAPLTASVTVGQGGNNFNPASVTIAAGGSVTWTWMSGGVGHNVTWLTAPGTLPTNSATMTSGTFTPPAGSFNTPGTYTYECSIHAPNMSGQVIVQ